eukprot:scaffold48854_cov63-Phaeocystis_antarctica.AAC.2
MVVALSSPDGASSPRMSAAANRRRGQTFAVLDRVPQHVFTLPARTQHLLARPRRLEQEAASKLRREPKLSERAAVRCQADGRESELLHQPARQEAERQPRDAHERPEAIGERDALHGGIGDVPVPVAASRILVRPIAGKQQVGRRPCRELDQTREAACEHDVGLKPPDVSQPWVLSRATHQVPEKQRSVKEEVS